MRATSARSSTWSSRRVRTSSACRRARPSPRARTRRAPRPRGVPRVPRRHRHPARLCGGQRCSGRGFLPGRARPSRSSPSAPSNPTTPPAPVTATTATGSTSGRAGLTSSTVTPTAATTTRTWTRTPRGPARVRRVQERTRELERYLVRNPLVAGLVAARMAWSNEKPRQAWAALQIAVANAVDGRPILKRGDADRPA